MNLNIFNVCKEFYNCKDFRTKKNTCANSWSNNLNILFYLHGITMKIFYTVFSSH